MPIEIRREYADGLIYQGTIPPGVQTHLGRVDSEFVSATIFIDGKKVFVLGARDFILASRKTNASSEVVWVLSPKGLTPKSIE